LDLGQLDLGLLEVHLRLAELVLRGEARVVELLHLGELDAEGLYVDGGHRRLALEVGQRPGEAQALLLLLVALEGHPLHELLVGETGFAHVEVEDRLAGLERGTGLPQDPQHPRVDGTGEEALELGHHDAGGAEGGLDGAGLDLRRADLRAIEGGPDESRHRADDDHQPERGCRSPGEALRLLSSHEAGVERSVHVHSVRLGPLQAAGHAETRGKGGASAVQRSRGRPAPDGTVRIRTRPPGGFSERPSVEPRPNALPRDG
jgi:hypothetical protein